MTADPHDTLIGADAIADYVNQIVDRNCAVTVKVVRHWIDRDVIPTGRFGRQVTASKSRIRHALSGQPAPAPQRPPLPAPRRR